MECRAVAGPPSGWVIRGGVLKNTGLLGSNEPGAFRVRVSWAAFRANPQAYGPSGSTHCDPRLPAGRSGPPPAPRPSPVGPGAVARSETWSPPPAGCIPQAAGRRGPLPSPPCGGRGARGGAAGWVAVCAFGGGLSFVKFDVRRNQNAPGCSRVGPPTGDMRQRAGEDACTSVFDFVRVCVVSDSQ